MLHKYGKLTYDDPDCYHKIPKPIVEYRPMQVLEDGSKYWGQWNIAKVDFPRPHSNGFRIKDYGTSDRFHRGGVWYEWGYFRTISDPGTYIEGHGICINSEGDRYEGNIKFNTFLCGNRHHGLKPCIWTNTAGDRYEGGFEKGFMH